MVRIVRQAVQALIKLLPDLRQVFEPSPAHKMASGDVPDLLLEKMRPHLEALQSRGFLAFATGSNKLIFGASAGGNVIELRLQVHDSYAAVADVM